jgi:tape measure domain-containing protein
MAEYTAGVVTVPVVPSFKGVHKSIGKELVRAITPAAEKAGEDAGKAIADKVVKPVSGAGVQVGKKLADGVVRSTSGAGSKVGKKLADDMVKSTSSTGAKVGKQIATGVAKSASNIASAASKVGIVAGHAMAGALNRALTPGITTVQNLVAGFNDSQAAASAFTGRMGTLGAALRRGLDPGIVNVQNLVAGFKDSQAAVSAFTGRAGTAGGVLRRALDPGVVGVQNLVAGFNDSQAAASAFTGRAGSMGGLLRRGLDPGIVGVQNMVSGFRNSQAAASAFTGRMGTTGGVLRRVFDGGVSAVTRLESVMGASMTRTEARGKTFGSRLYSGIATPLTKVGGLASGVFGRFGMNAATAAGLAGAAAIGMGVKFDAGLEQATQGFTTMLGSAQKAKTFLDSLQQFAASTPFQFPELVTASQRLIAFGFSAKDVIPTLTAIGDTAAGLGAGAEGVNQIVNAIGQMSAKGKIQSDELLQLTEVGVPALRILANQFHVSTGKMQEMVTKGVVPASKAVPLLLKGLEKGTTGAAGKTTAFTNLMQKQSTTLVGVWSNFVDVSNRKLGQLVAPALPYVKTALTGLTGLMQKGLGGLVSGKGAGTAVSAIKSAFASVKMFVTTSLLPSLRNIGTALGPTLRDVGGLVQSTVLPAFKSFGGILNGVIGPALRATTGFLAAHKVVLEAILAAVAAGITAYAALRAPMVIMTGIVRTIGLVTRAWAVAQGILNVVMDANPVGLVIIGIAALAAALVVAYKHSETFRGIVQGALHGVETAAKAVGAAAMWLWNNGIKPAFSGIMLAGRILAAVILTAVITPILLAFKETQFIVMTLWQAAIGPAFRGIGALALWLWHAAILPAWTGIKAVIGLAVGIIRTEISGLMIIFRAIGSAASWLWHTAIVPAWHGIGAVVSAVYTTQIHPILTALNAVFRNVIGPVFRWIYSSVIKPVWSGVGTAIRSVWTGVIRPVFDALKSGVSAVQKGFSIAVSAIGKIWKGLESITKKPVQFVVNVVYGKIREVWNKVAGLVGLGKFELPSVKFAQGGVLPGYTPGRDPHTFYSPTGGTVAMSGGEAIMRPEFTRAVGSDFVYAANAIARKRGVAGVRDMLGGGVQFANGGVYPGGLAQSFSLGGVFDAIKHAGSLVVHGASSLLDAGASTFAKHLLDPILGKIPGGDSTFAKAIFSLPKRMISGFIDFLKKNIDPKLGGDAHGVVAAAKKYIGIGDDRGPNNNRFSRRWGAAGQPWCAYFMDQAISDAHAGKYYRGFPTGLAAGFNSMRHVPTNSGQAGDLAVYGSPGSHINLIEKPQGGAYMTIGGNQNALVQRKIRGGQNHILRPSFASGGIVNRMGREAQRMFKVEAPRNADSHELQTPLVKLMRSLPAGQMGHVMRAIARDNLSVTNAGVYDNGGIIPPGLNLVANASRKPEALLNDTQWSAVTRAGSSGGDAPLIGTVVQQLPVGASPEEIFEELNFGLRRTRRGGVYAHD